MRHRLLVCLPPIGSRLKPGGDNRQDPVFTTIPRSLIPTGHWKTTDDQSFNDASLPGDDVRDGARCRELSVLTGPPKLFDERAAMARA